MSDANIDTTDDSLQRIGKVCRRINIVMRVAFLVFCILWVFATCLIIYSLIESGQFFSDFGASIFRIVLYVIYAVIIVSLFACILGLFSDVAKGESPFSMRQVKRLRLISCVLVAYTICDYLISWNSLVFQVAGVETGYISTTGNSIMPINVGPLIAAAVVFAFSFVFKYGVLLQEFSDDTL